MIDYCDIRRESKRAVKNMIDDAVAPISLIDRWHDENDLHAMAPPDAVNGLQFVSDLLLIGGTQRVVGLLQDVLVLHERHGILGSGDQLRTRRDATHQTRAATCSEGPRRCLNVTAAWLVGGSTTPGVVVAVRRAQRALLTSSPLKEAHDQGVVIQDLVQPVAEELPRESHEAQATNYGLRHVKIELAA
jgi:hypothetical protein